MDALVHNSIKSAVRGFITIGIGDYYRYLAKNLVKSFHLNVSKKYPFAIVTDKTDAETDQLFDLVIYEKKKYSDGCLYKLNLYNYSPFQESMFIDADSLIIRDIDFLWQIYTLEDFGVIGTNTSSAEYVKMNLQKVKNLHSVTEIPAFNGGLYYFKKSDRAQKIFQTAMQLLDKYNYYEMSYLRGTKNEEPLMALSMAIHEVKALETNIADPDRKGMYCNPGQKYFKMDILKSACSFYKYGVYTTPSIMHFGADKTNLFHYKREARKLKYAYDKKLPHWVISLLSMPVTVKYSISVILYRLIKKKILDPRHYRHVTPLEYNSK